MFIFFRYMSFEDEKKNKFTANAALTNKQKICCMSTQAKFPITLIM